MITITVLHFNKNQVHYLLDIKETVTVKEVVNLVKVGRGKGERWKKKKNSEKKKEKEKEKGEEGEKRRE
jgi:hypothetical protein